MNAAPRDLRLPSIDGLRAFEAAARLGTFERAAQELSITASAVSKRVGTLEDLLGTSLLARTGKALALTAAGKEYLAQVRTALGLLAAMPMHQRRTQRRQRLRVTAPPTFARQMLVPELEHYTRSHPQVELELLLSIPYLDTAAPDCDVEIRAGAGGLPGGRLLLDDRVLPVAAPALLDRLAPLRAPADLARAPLLRTPLEPWTPWFRAAGLDWPEPDAGPRLVDLGLTLEAAVSAQGVALARPTLARHWLDSGTLRPLFALTAPAAHPYQVRWRDDSAAAAAFVAWLDTVCAQARVRAAEWLSALT